MESLLLPLLSLFFFFLLQFPSPALTQDGYFISCGSDGNTTIDDGRVFTGDYKSSYLSGDGDNALKDTSNSNSLYHTARVFTRTSSYKFPINSSRTHVVRLHFFPFISHGYNLSSAVFDVSVSGDFLFRRFTAGTNKNVTLKEYFLKVNTTKLEISFTPTWKSSFAFVNAVEVFPAPDNLISDTAKLVGPTGSRLDYNGLFEKVLETIHRINVGGPKITDSNLWRSWIPDEQFLVVPQAAKPATHNAPIINWGLVTRDIAPENVYNTAQQMNRDNNSLSQNFNITWRFGVSSDSKYLVRLHFCDIVSEQLDELYFHVYIGDSFAIRDLHLGELVYHLAAPHYADFVADPDNSNQIKISVGPSETTTSLSKRNAILNGVEIMKIIDGGVSRKNMRKLSIGVLVGAVVGVSAFSLLLVVVSVLVFKCRRKTTAKPRSEESGSWLLVSVHGRSTHTTPTERTDGSDHPNKHLGLKMSLTDLRLATKNFHETSLIGSGGFGNVYRGVLQDGTIIAVKRGKPESRQGLSEFVAEITVLSQIRHRHLVSLIGYCEEQSEMILVYEFMENGPLKRHLYGSNLPSLSWKQRIQICIDSSRGLHYLHTGSANGIIHRDVKTVNILLDKNYSAKVADFGLSKAVLSLDQSHITTMVKGTFGYLDPEYYKRRHLTEKSDVFSFGVVLLEVLCARPAVDVSLPRDQVNLAEWALESLKKGLLEQIIDRRLVGQINPNSLRKFMETVQRCLSEYGADRPTIGDVLWNLEYVLQLQDIPVHREAYEDSAVSAVGPPLPNVRRVPSRSVQLENDDPSSNGNGSSETTASGVFSQLFGSDGR